MDDFQELCQVLHRLWRDVLQGGAYLVGGRSSANGSNGRCSAITFKILNQYAANAATAWVCRHLSLDDISCSFLTTCSSLENDYLLLDKTKYFISIYRR